MPNEKKLIPEKPYRHPIPEKQLRLFSATFLFLSLFVPYPFFSQLKTLPSGLILEDSLRSETAPPKLMLTDFQLFGKSQVPGPGAILQQPIASTKKLTLQHHLNDITLCFAAGSRRLSRENRYSFKLEGFDREWSPFTSQDNARYTHLPHGNYTFRLKVDNNEIKAEERELTLQIVILPPWYATGWAFGLFALLAFSLFYAIYRILLSRQSASAQPRRSVTGESGIVPGLYGRTEGAATPPPEPNAPAGQGPRLPEGSGILNAILQDAENLSASDKDFLDDAYAVVKAHLSDTEFNLHVLCRKLGMARSPLHKRLKALTGRSTTRYIRAVRLYHARELLCQTSLPVSDVAYSAGFKDPNFFSTCFKDEFGLTPTNIRKKKQ